ncbi:MAG: serine/threonine-protein phosphatase [Ruminococcus sp.]|nr:serine/threonine-protein phosphatase [Ruminococcus sp.]
MRYIAAAQTDIGTVKDTNQDSYCLKTASSKYGRTALILVCDGMGGLSKGELASSEVVRTFSEWFENELPNELGEWNWKRMAAIVTSKIKLLNKKIIDYGKKYDIQLGTTATGMLVFGTKYMIFHVGDSRLYKFSYQLQILTEDHTFINRELKKGAITPEQAKTHPKRNALVQCIGVAGRVDPDITFGSLENNVNYLICSDGFRHAVSEKELFDNLSPNIVTTRTAMTKKMADLIETIKERGERDNITAAMFRADF